MCRLSTVFELSTRVAFGAILFLLCLVGACRSFWFGRASVLASRSDSRSLQEAIRLAPDAAEYVARWGLTLDDPSAQRAAFERAAAMNPYNSWVWLQLGLLADAQNDDSRAERLLLKSADTNKGLGPMWALLNYYYRKSSPERFWYWVREALLVDNPDPVPVFRLAWRFTPDARTIMSRALPAGEAPRERFFEFVLHEKPVDAASPIAAAILRYSKHLPRELLMTYCDRQIEAGNTGAAVEVWNAFCDRNLVALAPVDPNQVALVNSRFSAPFSGRGFDWIKDEVPGITLQFHPSVGSGLVVQFSGRQCEHCRLLRQRIPVVPRSRYRLEWRFESEGPSKPSGLTWRVHEGVGESDPLAESSEWRLGDNARQTLEFIAPERYDLVTLALVYNRQRGFRRLDGAVRVTDLNLHVAR